MRCSLLLCVVSMSPFTSVTAPLISADDWYLSILGVLPEQQGRGVGRSLVEPVLEDADAADIATYLETFAPRSIPFYQRLGYEILGEIREPVTGSDYWLMRRKPLPR